MWEDSNFSLFCFWHQWSSWKVCLKHIKMRVTSLEGMLLSESDFCTNTISQQAFLNAILVFFPDSFKWRAPVGVVEKSWSKENMTKSGGGLFCCLIRRDSLERLQGGTLHLPCRYIIYKTYWLAQNALCQESAMRTCKKYDGGFWFTYNAFSQTCAKTIEKLKLKLNQKC